MSQGNWVKLIIFLNNSDQELKEGGFMISLTSLKVLVLSIESKRMSTSGQGLSASKKL